MRRFLILLAALILLSLPVLAEETDSSIPYSHPTLGYTMNIPEDWIILDSAAAEETVEKILSGEIELDIAEGDLTAYARQIELTDMVYLLPPDRSCIFNIVVQDLYLELTNDMLLESLCPYQVQQYKNDIPCCLFDDEGSAVLFGETEFIRMSLTCPLSSGERLRLLQYSAMFNTKMTACLITISQDEQLLSLEEAEEIYRPIVESLFFPENVS